jgi:hypothetical protein
MSPFRKGGLRVISGTAPLTIPQPSKKSADARVTKPAHWRPGGGLVYNPGVVTITFPSPTTNNLMARPDPQTYIAPNRRRIKKDGQPKILNNPTRLSFWLDIPA